MMSTGSPSDGNLYPARNTQAFITQINNAYSSTASFSTTVMSPA